MDKSITHYLAKKDQTLASILPKVDLKPVPSTHDVFHDLLSCILEQQIHYRSTKNIFGKMLERAGLERVSLENFERFEEEGIAKVKLSDSKYETLARILDFFAAHELDWQELSDAEVRSTLKQIKGVGPWTQDMILLYTLGRPDIVPLDDYHLKNLMVSHYGLDQKVKLKARMREVAAEWSPHGSTAVLALLEWKTLQQKRKP